MSFTNNTVYMETVPDKDLQVGVRRRGLKKVFGELEDLKRTQGDIFRKIYHLLQSALSNSPTDTEFSSSHCDYQECAEHDLVAAVGNIKRQVKLPELYVMVITFTPFYFSLLTAL